MKNTMLVILLAALASITAVAVESAAKPYPLDKCIVSDEKLGVEGKPVVFVHEGQEIKLCCQDCRKDFDANPAKYLAKLPKAGNAPKSDEPAKPKGMAMKSCCMADGKDGEHDHAAMTAKGDDKAKMAGMDHKMCACCAVCACCAAEAKLAEGHDHAAAKPAAEAAKPHDHEHADAAKTEPAKDAPAKPYPLKTCIVSDNDLDSMGEQASFVYQGQTIKVCCKSCIAKFEKNPAKYLKKLEGK